MVHILQTCMSAVKVPFIIRLPESNMRGSVCRMAASQYDIFPTILELADCPPETEPLQPGQSLVPHFRCPSVPIDRDVVIFDEYGKTRMIKKMDLNTFIIMMQILTSCIILLRGRTRLTIFRAGRNMNLKLVL